MVELVETTKYPEFLVQSYCAFENLRQQLKSVVEQSRNLNFHADFANSVDFAGFFIFLHFIQNDKAFVFSIQLMDYLPQQVNPFFRMKRKISTNSTSATIVTVLSPESEATKPAKSDMFEFNKILSDISENIFIIATSEVLSVNSND